MGLLAYRVDHVDQRSIDAITSKYFSEEEVSEAP